VLGNVGMDVKKSKKLIV